MSYSSARQLAGLSGAGTLAMLATIAFAYQLPSTFFPYHGGPFYADWAALWVVYLAYSVVSLPFDIWAGFVVPCRHQRRCQMLPVYLGHLFRGLLVQGMVMTVSALLLLQAGKAWGVWGAEAVFGLLLSALFVMRPMVAGALGGGADRALPGRYYALGGGWLLMGFLLCAWLPWCGVGTLFNLLETLLGCSLWSLAGLWILGRFHQDAARASMYLSWASFGLLSRAAPSVAGVPERWANPVGD
ncbi:MAG TPA: hypothetical protein VGK29_13005 [Paludibaculum sp.]|jgi:hypothetical protein